MDYIISSMKYYFNYTTINKSNIFNFLFIVIKKLECEERKEFINTMILIMGKIFCHDFKLYIFEKQPNSNILTLF